jgi:hypothetical protein
MVLRQSIDEGDLPVVSWTGLETPEGIAPSGRTAAARCRLSAVVGPVEAERSVVIVARDAVTLEEGDPLLARKVTEFSRLGELKL